jgi:hypothetical protein
MRSCVAAVNVGQVCNLPFIRQVANLPHAQSSMATLPRAKPLSAGAA